MNQPQNPYDPAPDSHGAEPPEMGSPTSDPAQHPHDPFAAPQQPYDAPQGQQYQEQQPYAEPQGQQHEYPQHEQQYAGAQQQAYTGQQPAFGSPQQAAGSGAFGSEMPPTGIKGVHEGPLTGQPATESDARLWSLFAHLSAIIGYVIGFGLFGWLGPLIIFLVYKDRNRFVRYNAAEALNAAIATLIAEIALAIVFGIITVITLGLGSVLFALIGVPALIHVVFAIIGAVKANKGEWWNYPVNIRIVK